MSPPLPMRPALPPIAGCRTSGGGAFSCGLTTEQVKHPSPNLHDARVADLLESDRAHQKRL